ncbi:hypothetical protein [Dongia sp.]|uniref:hypothetical protein n=1 Tax=Dongia sp. TaxID=1977262 RepID=UPI0035B4922A
MISGRLTILAVCVFTAGCQSWGRMVEEDPSTAGARLLNINYEQVDLISLLDPEGMARQKYTPEPGQPAWEALPIGRQIDLAFDAYHKTEAKLELDEPAKKRRRDQVQERLLGASNDMCYRYKRFLQNVHSHGNFFFGALTTIAGAAGAIVTGGGSQILAGTASALSGIRAEFNQDYFSNLTVATVWKGIELRRDRAFNTIAIEGQEKDTFVYPVEAAVKDAINYHAECSLVAGVEELGDTVQLAKDPGLDQVSRTLLKLNIARKIVETQSTDPGDLLGDATPGSPSAALLEFGTPRGDGRLSNDNDPILAFGETLNIIRKRSEAALAKVNQLKYWPEGVTDIDGAQDTFRKLAVTRIAERSQKAAQQVSACKDVAVAKSTEILEAQAAAGTATAEAQRTALAKVETALLEGQALASKFTPAQTWLSADLDTFLRELSAAEIAAKNNESKRMDATVVTNAADKLSLSTKNSGALDCEAVVAPVTDPEPLGPAEETTPPADEPTTEEPTN